MAKKKTSEKTGPESLTFEQALAQVEQAVTRLEEGELGLDEALAQYEAGLKHLKRCHQLLERAEQKIETLTGVDAQGNPMASPLAEGEASEGGASPTPVPGRRRRAAKLHNPADAPPRSATDVDAQGGLF